MLTRRPPPSSSRSFLLHWSNESSIPQLNQTSLLIVLYCTVLYWWDSHCCLMHCDLFKIFCAPPNLGITTTWICRLNFAQRPIFQAWGSWTSLKSQTRDSQLKVPPGGLVLRIFTSWKNPSNSARFEPANLVSRGDQNTFGRQGSYH